MSVFLQRYLTDWKIWHIFAVLNNLVINKTIIIMKKIFCTIALAMFVCSAFAQQKIEATYVEAGVNENDPSTYKAKEVVMPDGKKETMLFKKKHFNQDNVKISSSYATALSIEDMISVIERKKKQHECVKEMYEEDGLYYMLFTKCNTDGQQ